MEPELKPQGVQVIWSGLGIPQISILASPEKMPYESCVWGDSGAWVSVVGCLRTSREGRRGVTSSLLLPGKWQKTLALGQGFPSHTGFALMDFP